jgi:hypothetical protein
MSPEWEFATKSLFDPAVFWSMVTAIATAALIFVAWRQLSSLAKTSRSDFLFRLRKDFFTEEARKLIFLAEYDLLRFHHDEIPYFETVIGGSPAVIERMKDLKIERGAISTYFVDDFLLGPLEDMGVLENMGLVSLEEVYESFFTYLSICVENTAIKQFLEFARTDQKDWDVYDNLLSLYNKLQKQAPRIRAKKARSTKIRHWVGAVRSKLHL